MRLSYLVLAGLMLASSAVFADPHNSKAVEQPRVAEPTPAAAIVLASADTLRPNVGESASPADSRVSKRRIVPRVTACRCGDPQPQSDAQDQ